MTTETEPEGRAGGRIEMVLDEISEGQPSSEAHQPLDADGITVVDEATEAVHGPRVDVLVVHDAHVKATHADAPQVFASAARLRPLFAVLSFVLVVCVVLAVFGMTVLVPG